MRLSTFVAALIFCLTPVAHTSAEDVRPGLTCSVGANAQIRSTLYFGRLRPGGVVSEAEWQDFLRDDVTPRFPDGLTAWDAQGQWRSASGSIDREPTKVLSLLHANTPAARTSVQDIIASYRKKFEQEAVLWETAAVCAAF